MASLLERKLIVVTGKGGTGKSTVACALGLIAARRGLRTIVVEVGAQQHMADLFATEGSPVSAPRDSERSKHPDHPKDHLPLEHKRFAHNDPHRPHLYRSRHGEEVELQQNLWITSLDPDRAMTEWLQALTGRISARLLASSSTFQYFAAAAPGAKELVSMIKARELCEGRDGGKSASGGNAPSNTPRKDGHHTRHYDLVVLDAPATGHALAMLRSPQTFAAIVRVGPLAEQAGRVRGLLEDPRRSAYVAVTHATEMAVTETLELEEGLQRELDRDLDAVVVNGTVPRRFTREELGQIAELDVKQIAQLHTNSQVVHSATRIARAVYERARVQQSQIARLRRQRFAERMPPGVVTIPFVFTPELDLVAVRNISAQLERKL
jgi:anion-transporting  ArsA/GET3 family ATPase